MAKFASWIVDLLNPAIGLLAKVIRNVFPAIGNIIGGIWNTIIKPVFDAYRYYIMDIVVPAIMWLWKNAVQPAFDAIGGIIQSVWNSTVKPVTGFIGDAFRGVGDAATQAKDWIIGAWD